MDFTRATELTPEVEAAIKDAFIYHPWDEDKIKKGEAVGSVLIDAIRTIIAVVPLSPYRNAAIRKIREARMDCNSAIAHAGKY